MKLLNCLLCNLNLSLIRTKFFPLRFEWEKVNQEQLLVEQNFYRTIISRTKLVVGHNFSRFQKNLSDFVLSDKVVGKKRLNGKSFDWSHLTLCLKCFHKFPLNCFDCYTSW